MRTRQVALLVADGVDAGGVASVQSALAAAGATLHLISARLGPVKAAGGTLLDATGSFENSAPVVFDALVLPDGAAGVKRLGAQPEVRDFIVSQYRHGKTILALGASKALLESAGLTLHLQGAQADPGLLLGSPAKTAAAIAFFIAALAKHRHPERETAMF